MLLAHDPQHFAAPARAAGTEREAAHAAEPTHARGELHLLPAFLSITVGAVVLTLLLLGSHLVTFPALHVFLDTANFALPLLTAVLLREIARQSGDDLLSALSMGFGICSVLCFLHLASGLEWWGSLGWIVSSASLLRPRMWAPSAYFLPLALMVVVLRAGGDARHSLAGVGFVLAALAAALLVLFWNLQPYAEPSLFGMNRPLLLAVALLWAVVAAQASRLRPGHPIWQAVPFMAVLMIAAASVMLRSSQPEDAAAMIAHTGTLAAFAFALVTTLKLAALDSRRRIEAQTDLSELTRTLERRVEMRTSELQANVAELKAYERRVQRQARHATLQAEILTAFTRREGLDSILEHVAAAVARELDVDVAQIWTLELGSRELELQAHVGTADVLRDVSRPLYSAGIATVARRGEPLLSNDARDDDRVGDKEWVTRHGFTAFAGYPLQFENRVEGVLAVFATHRLEEPELLALFVAASAISLGIAHKRDQTAVRDLYDNAPCGYHSLDENGLIVAINDTELAWFGYTRQEIVGRKRFPEILTPDSREVFARTFPRLKKTGRLRDVEYEIVRKDGTTFPALLSSTVVVDYQGRFVATRSTLFDITERKRVEERATSLKCTLSARSQALEEVNRELEAFTYTVSHDLRAPLRRIRGFADLLVEDTKEKLPEDTRHHVKVITESTAEMGRLIDGFLEFSRTGRQEMREAVVSLGELAREVIADYEVPSRKRNVRWHVQPLPEVRGDRALLKQVLANLIDNALEYSCSRKAAHIEIGSAGSDSGEVVVFVRDNGVGFAMEHANNLFGVFQRLSNSSQYQGNGVGLATVQRIVQRHGGRVWAEAAENEGATFYFTLRAASAADVLAAGA